MKKVAAILKNTSAGGPPQKNESTSVAQLKRLTRKARRVICSIIHIVTSCVAVGFLETGAQKENRPT